MCFIRVVPYLLFIYSPFFEKESCKNTIQNNVFPVEIVSGTKKATDKSVAVRDI